MRWCWLIARLDAISRDVRCARLWGDHFDGIPDASGKRLVP